MRKTSQDKPESMSDTYRKKRAAKDKAAAEAKAFDEAFTRDKVRVDKLIEEFHKSPQPQPQIQPPSQFQPPPHERGIGIGVGMDNRALTQQEIDKILLEYSKMETARRGDRMLSDVMSETVMNKLLSIINNDKKTTTTQDQAYKLRYIEERLYNLRTRPTYQNTSGTSLETAKEIIMIEKIRNSILKEWASDAGYSEI